MQLLAAALLTDLVLSFYAVEAVAQVGNGTASHKAAECVTVQPSPPEVWR